VPVEEAVGLGFPAARASAAGDQALVFFVCVPSEARSEQGFDV